MDVGLELRQARERRGVTLQQVSHTTKISLRVLQAIEASDETRLPATVFTRSFVKSYAGLMDLNPDDTSRRYLEQFKAPEPPAPVDAAQNSNSKRDADSGESRAELVAHVLQGRFGSAAVLFLAGVTAFALIAKNYRQTQAGATHVAPAHAVSAAGVVPAPAPPATPVGTSGAAAPPPGDALHLAIAPTGPCWVAATVGSESVLAKLLDAGDRRTVDTPSDVTLRVGDPATFAFSINGKPARVAGTPGQALTVHITKENYASFLAK